MKHLYDGIMEMPLGVTSVDDIVEKMNDVTVIVANIFRLGVLYPNLFR